MKGMNRNERNEYKNGMNVISNIYAMNELIAFFFSPLIV
jgi:hypothetical protein